MSITIRHRFISINKKHSILSLHSLTGSRLQCYIIFNFELPSEIKLPNFLHTPKLLLSKMPYYKFFACQK
jgi:hypothetical protein